VWRAGIILATADERNCAGLTAAAARGRKGGRPVAATPERMARARQLIASGLNLREAAARIKIGKSALYAALKADQIKAAADK
jgi:DNA invertase Pin-like site-specific DNA recombinase